MTEHTDRELGHQLEALRARLSRMAGLVESMMGDSVRALVHGDVELATQILGKLEERYRPQGCLHGRKHISANEVPVVMCPPDGNCLFTALGVAMTICMDKPMPSYSERTELGASIRNRFLTEIGGPVEW